MKAISRIRAMRNQSGASSKGLTSLEASKQIDLGQIRRRGMPRRDSTLNVERAYREFRKEPADAPWDKANVLRCDRSMWRRLEGSRTRVLMSQWGIRARILLTCSPS